MWLPKGRAKYIRHAGDIAQHICQQFWLGLSEKNEVYALQSHRPISFCSCRLLFNVFVYFRAVVISTGIWLWGQGISSRCGGASWAPKNGITDWLSLSLNCTRCAAHEKSRHMPDVFSVADSPLFSTEGTDGNNAWPAHRQCLTPMQLIPEPCSLHQWQLSAVVPQEMPNWSVFVI